MNEIHIFKVSKIANVAQNILILRQNYGGYILKSLGKIFSWCFNHPVRVEHPVYVKNDWFDLNRSYNLTYNKKPLTTIRISIVKANTRNYLKLPYTINWTLHHWIIHAKTYYIHISIKWIFDIYTHVHAEWIQSFLGKLSACIYGYVMEVLGIYVCLYYRMSVVFFFLRIIQSLRVDVTLGWVWCTIFDIVFNFS